MGRPSVPGTHDAAHFRYVLRLGDDNLILAQRLAEWSSRAHDLEDDIALTNIGLDHLGQARALLTHAGDIEAKGRSEDDLAFHRAERDFTNLLLVERPNGDFAHTIVRQLLVSTFQISLWEALSVSTDETLAGIAAKALKEARYHYEYAGTWTLRLGDGTAESSGRMEAALASLWRYTDELFVTDEVDRDMIARQLGADLGAFRPTWQERIETILHQATLHVPDDPLQRSGGRIGMHGSEFGFLLAEMQHLPRSMPEAAW